MIVSLIAAVSENNVIGRDRGMPWHMPEDLKYFYRVTKGHHVIMGRKTFQEFGVSKPLPERTNIVISGQRGLKLPGVYVIHSLEEALAFAKEKAEDEVFIIGGGHIYSQSIDFAHKLYITKIHTSIADGDTFFPEIDNEKWKVGFSEYHSKDGYNPYDYTFITYLLK